MDCVTGRVDTFRKYKANEAGRDLHYIVNCAL